MNNAYVTRVALTIGCLSCWAMSVRAQPIMMMMQDTTARAANTDIIVVGSGVLTEPPQILTLEVALGAVGPTAVEAMDRVGKRADEFVEDFRRFGLKPDDWSRRLAIARRPMPGEPKTLAFWATVRLTVHLDEFGAATDMFDRATELKVAAIEFYFQLNDPQLAYERTLKRALADARYKAEALAKEADLKIGDLLGCEELSEPPLPVPAEDGENRDHTAGTTGASAIPQPRREADYRPRAITTVARVRARFALVK